MGSTALAGTPSNSCFRDCMQRTLTRMSRTHALWPPCYKKRLLQFHFSHSTEPVPYIIGQPVTITVEEVSIDGVQGHVLYGLVCCIESDMDHRMWPQVKTKILVKVHAQHGGNGISI